MQLALTDRLCGIVDKGQYLKQELLSRLEEMRQIRLTELVKVRVLSYLIH